MVGAAAGVIGGNLTTVTLGRDGRYAQRQHVIKGGRRAFGQRRVRLYR